MKIMYLSSTHAGMHSHSIYYDLMCELRDHGHDVTIVYAREKRLNQATNLYRNDGMRYLGVKTGNISKNRNLIEKGISTITIDPIMKKAVKKYLYNERFDVVLYSTPPITLLKTLKYVKGRLGARAYLMLKDIFPQNAVDLEMFKMNGLMYKFFRKKEISLYELFDRIGVMSPANKDYLLRHNKNIKEHVVEILPNSLKVKDRKKQDITKEYFGIDESKVVFAYGGNLGKPQDIPFVIECLKSIESLSNVHVVIAGTGGDAHLLEEYLDEFKPSNFSYFGQLDSLEYNRLISISDVGLIFLDFRFTIPNFPQRLLSYMEASLPVLCATDAAADIGDIVENNEFGIKTYSNDIKSWYNGVAELANSKELRLSLGANAYNYLIDNYTVEKSYEILNKFIMEERNV